MNDSLHFLMAFVKAKHATANRWNRTLEREWELHAIENSRKFSRYSSSGNAGTSIALFFYSENNHKIHKKHDESENVHCMQMRWRCICHAIKWNRKEAQTFSLAETADGFCVEKESADYPVETLGSRSPARQCGEWRYYCTRPLRRTHRHQFECTTSSGRSWLCEARSRLLTPTHYDYGFY